VVQLARTRNLRGIMLSNASNLFLSWVLRIFVIFIGIVAWLGYAEVWQHIGKFSLGFLAGSLLWPVVISVIVLLSLALSMVMRMSFRRD
jgi:hypothetical protein